MDRQEVLNWIIELLEKQKSQPADDGILRLFLPLTLQYLDEFVQSELLSRRLAHLCAKKLGFMLNNVAETNLITSPNSEIKIDPKDGDKEKKENVPPNPMQSTLIEYQNCPHHRDIGKKKTLKLSNCMFFFCISFAAEHNHPNDMPGMPHSFGLVWHGCRNNLARFSFGQPANSPVYATCSGSLRYEYLPQANNSG